MQYKIVKDDDPDNLSQTVEVLLNDGWELHGSLVIVGDSQHLIYAQALTHEQDSIEPPAEMSSVEAARVLAELLKIPVDQLPQATQENLEKINELLQGIARQCAGIL
jgi:hypothetical protein